ncbi:MAG: hypothetical protein QOF21_2739, partial [Actinomycetota bacterium]
RWDGLCGSSGLRVGGDAEYADRDAREGRDGESSTAHGGGHGFPSADGEVVFSVYVTLIQAPRILVAPWLSMTVRRTKYVPGAA